MRVNDWMKLNCGDFVVERDTHDQHGRDGRHVGRVEAVHHGAFVKVRWLDTGWISELRLGDVRKLTLAELRQR
jgi:hypothetical protein